MMIQLTANRSASLMELLHSSPGIVDAFEFGSWFSLEDLRAQRKALPEMPFHFHGGRLLLKVGWPGVVARAQAYVRLSGSPWASFHLMIWPYWMASLIFWTKMRLPRPNPEWETRRLLWQINRLKRALPVPLTLENIEPLPAPGFVDHSYPHLIKRVLEQTGCNLLLDLGHARVSAAAMGMEVRDYINQLPLERVVQIHVSGPRMKNGRLFDAHETMQEEDYTLLEFTLQRTQPQVVTLEYIREGGALREQLVRLRALITR